MSDPPKVYESTGDGSGETIVRDATPEEIAAADAAGAHGAKQKLSEQQALFADNERLRVINERARTDPAYAALANLALGGRGL